MSWLPSLSMIWSVGLGSMIGSVGLGSALEAPREASRLVGKLLVAQPRLRDPNFRRTVVFMVRHDDLGAFGLVVNRPIGSTAYAELIEALGGSGEDVEGEVAVHYGGPVRPEKAFVLHTVHEGIPGQDVVDGRYAVTLSPDLLRSMASGGGPEHAILTSGYSGWAPGQLERELARGDWAIAPADDAILFDGDYGTKWKRALERRYVET